MISIKQSVQLENITVRTLRYYDEIGLLQPTSYNGKMRIYDEKAIKQLQEIQTWKSFGLSLQQFIEVLSNDSKHEKLIPLLENKKIELSSTKNKLICQQIQ